MARLRTRMSKIKELLRLKFDCHLPNRSISACLNIGGSTIIISQLPVSEWYKLVGNPTVADALMDRLLHNGHRVELRGESMRKLAKTDHTG